MKYCGTSVLLLFMIVCTEGFFAQSEPPESRGPRVLSNSEAQPYYEIFNKYPGKIRKAFGLSLNDDELPSYFKCRAMNEYPYPQTIHMPNSETLMIISGYSEVGLIIFDTKTKEIKKVICWSDYLRTEIEESIKAFEEVHFRFRQYEDRWKLVAEVHAITGQRFEPHTHYFWEFTYAGCPSYSAYGSSFLYCTKDTGWSPLPERIKRDDTRQDW